MTGYLQTDDSYLNQSVRLLTDVLGNAVNVRIGPLGMSSAWDHVVRTTADLPVPAGGYIDLTTGSWALAASVDIGTDRLRVQPGQTVFLKGMGWDKVLTSSAGAAIEVRGDTLLDTLTISSSGNQAISHPAASHLQCNSVQVLGTCARSATLEAGTNVFNDCRLRGADYCMTLNGSGTEELQVNGGIWANANEGARFLGDWDRALFAHVRINTLNRGIYWNGGSQRVVQVIGCSIAATAGIEWAAANIPTDGLLVLGTAFNCLNNYVAHTPASARANYKSNSQGGGLLTETAIVP
jgi:hypothetical protein